MNWNNLKQNKCPECDEPFNTFSFNKRGLVACSCGFRISEKRFSEIVNSQITQDLQDKWDNNLEGGEL